MPAYSTRIEITMALIYSIRPYPKGCFRSASFPASFVPTIVMTELAASDRLLTASITMAMEFAVIPTTALNAARRTLARIPMILVRMIILPRSFCPFILCCTSFEPSLHIIITQDRLSVQTGGDYMSHAQETSAIPSSHRFSSSVPSSTKRPPRMISAFLPSGITAVRRPISP